MSALQSATTVGLRLGTPITAAFLPVFTSYLCILGYRVVSTRVSTGTFVGDRSVATTEGRCSQDKPDPLTIAARAHGNFMENVPYALTLAALAEVNGGNGNIIAGALGTLFALRLVHVEIGVRGKSALGPGRIIGFFGTLGYMLGMSGYVAWLTKGYWGF
ncbi:hypothetical protein ABW19_dt0203978 [Dactylella cylindrospora]|nr:hypothetical protein ABW19_dt0203978 [Dactylella cylindrospora]